MILHTSAYPYPVLEEERFDYKSAEYSIKQVREDSNHIYLEHRLLGAEFLIELLKNKKAKFVTTVVVKEALYRETYSDIEEEISANRVVQKIPLLKEGVNHSFYAHLVYVGEDEEFELNYDDMDEFWRGKRIKLFKGSVLAKDGWRDLDFGVGDLFKIQKDESLEVSFNTEISFDDGGRIVCFMNKELYDKALKYPTSLQLRSVISHALSQAFLKLSRLDEIPNNFSSIIYKLKERGLDIKSQDFDPVKASLIILPHVLGECDE